MRDINLSSLDAGTVACRGLNLCQNSLGVAIKSDRLGANSVHTEYMLLRNDSCMFHAGISVFGALIQGTETLAEEQPRQGKCTAFCARVGPPQLQPGRRPSEDIPL